MGAPLYVVSAPCEVWIAPTGESFPAIEDAPAGNWVKIGTDGARSVTEDGVRIQFPQTIEEIRTAGSTGPIKPFRTSEGPIITFSIMDMTLEVHKYGLNNNTVSDTAANGGAGYRDIDLYMGLDVDTRALLVRALNGSAYLADTDFQYQFPVVYEAGVREIAGQKGIPMMLAFEYRAIEDPDASTAADRFGKLVMEDEAAP